MQFYYRAGDARYSRSICDLGQLSVTRLTIQWVEITQIYAGFLLFTKIRTFLDKRFLYSL